MNLYQTLQKLCAIPAVSGREAALRSHIEALLAPHCDELRTDALGNLIACKKGKGKAPTLLFCAHMDEIGFLVTFLEENGMLRIAPVGGISFAASAFSAVISNRGVRGVLVPNAKTKAADYKADVFYIDIGAKSRKDAERRVSIGDFFVAESRVFRLGGSRVAGRPLDDRLGCAVLLGIAETLSDVSPMGDIYYVFSVQEEVGCRGSRPAAFATSADYALSLDVTATGDTPEATPMACSLGGGAAVKIKDSSVICSEELTTLLCTLAEEQRIPYQREILLAGGTDASSLQLAGAGSRAGGLSIPCRYIHSGVEVCDLKDAEACLALGVALAKSLSRS